MSFADALREELAEIAVKKPCCRRSLTLGLLWGAEIDEAKIAHVIYKQSVTAALSAQMIRASYGKAPMERSFGKCGHRFWELSFSAPSFYKLYKQLESNSVQLSELVDHSCEGCRSAFLRGLFLASGTVNDPHKNFHLEILQPTARADKTEAFLTFCGYPPKRINRPKGIGLYYKDSSAVEDLLALMGAQHTIFEVINSRIEREIRNNENRATNCVAKNIEKTVSAATRHMEAINKLMEHGKLENLPEGVKSTAMLRYRNPDATLDELARMHDPIISKSGLNHRLQKILEAADDI